MNAKRKARKDAAREAEAAKQRKAEAIATARMAEAKRVLGLK